MTATAEKPVIGQWQSIETAPFHTTVLVADERVGTVAVSFQRTGGWMLGDLGIADPDELEFEPRWWLPWNFKGNPFNAALPEPPETPNA